jgi:hypothetical protein
MYYPVKGAILEFRGKKYVLKTYYTDHKCEGYLWFERPIWLGLRRERLILPMDYVEFNGEVCKVKV